MNRSVDTGVGGPSAFGSSLLRHRRAAGLTQEALAEASGVSVRALRDLEHGRARAAQRRSAEILADALKLRGDDREEFLRTAREERRRTTSTSMGAAGTASGLPSPVELVGRADELARLRSVAADGGGTVVIVGPPGVGKTALGVFAAHVLRSTFPDGAVWVDMRGMDDHPLPVGAALERLLRGLGVPESGVPRSDADRADMYRATVAGRRVLVVLDNVADEGQVRPLLVGSAGSMTLVTCRYALAGLEDVRWVWLEPLAGAHSVELLDGILGDDRVRREPQAAAELVGLCGNLPLAVRIASNRLASRPHWSLAYLVEQLRDERIRLSALSAGDLQVRSAFEISYRRLSPGARVAFRRLTSVPGTDFGAGLAEVVTGLTNADVLPLLDELVDAGLVQTAQTDGRFHYHDLIRVFANERWKAEDSPADQVRLSEAVLRHLLGSARAACSMYLAEEDQPADELRAFGSVAEAADWLAREESNWLAALWVAADRGLHRDVVELAGAVIEYADLRWMALPWAAIFQLGVESARAIGDQSGEARALNYLAWAQSRVHLDIRGALATFQQALAVAEAAGDRLRQATVHGHIGATFRALGDLAPALVHVQRGAELNAELNAESNFWCHHADAQYHLGRVLEMMGRYEEALAVHRAVLAGSVGYSGSRFVVWRKMEACTRMGIGSCLHSMGEWRLAAETFDQARSGYLGIDSAANAGDASLKAGRAWLEAGEYALARERLRDALELYGDPAPQRVMAEVHAELARLPEQ